MAISSTDIHPVALAREAVQTVRESWLQVTFAGGIFVLLSLLIRFLAGTTDVREMVFMGDAAASFSMFLATLAAALVTSARVLGVDIPYLPSALINERYFWRYVWRGVICLMVVGSVVAVCSFVGFSFVEGRDFRPFYAGAAAGALLSGFLYVRLSMMLPGAAAGEKVSLTASWRMTRGIWIRIGLAMVLALGGFLAGEFLLKGLSALTADPASHLVLAGFGIFLKIVRCAVEGALAAQIFLAVLSSQETSASAAADADMLV